MRGVPLWPVVLLVLAVAGGCDEAPTNPVRPSPPTETPPFAGPPAPTRILRLTSASGDAVIDFGGVEVGLAEYREFLICNDGSAGLTIEEISSPDGFSAYWDVWEWGDTITILARGCEAGYAYFAPRRTGRYEGSVAVKANYTAGNNTIRVVGTGMAPPQAPLTIFGEGQHLVGLGIAPGRYHSNPNGQCLWWRTSRYPVQSWDDDVIAQDTTWYDPGHWIVDILPSDAEFNSESGCGWWDQWPGPKPTAGTIPHGVWEVNRHIQPGRYQTDSRAGCRWERLRHFQWTSDGLIEGQETTAAGTIIVNILRSDAGFLSSPDCGVWTRIP